MKIPNRKEIRETAYNHSADIDLKCFETIQALNKVIDTTLLVIRLYDSEKSTCVSHEERRF